MFKKTPMTAVILFALVATTTVAMAASPEGRAGFRGPVEFSQLDSNSDGIITQEDLAALAEARFARIDADGNGEVTRAELTAAAETRDAERMERRIDRMMDRADADDSGTLTLAELSSGGDRRSNRMFEHVDANGDGQITEAEFDAAERPGRKGHDRENR